MNKTKNAIVYVIAFVFLFITTSILYSQSFPYHHYTEKEGLPSTIVNSIIQDKTGFIWFATGGGLIRFDGYEFKIFDETDGLNSNITTGLLLSEDSTLYISNLKAGINIYKDNKISKYEINNMSNLYITHFVLKNDTFYVRNAPVIEIIVKNEMKHFFREEFSKDQFEQFVPIILRNLFIDSRNNLLAGGRDGLYLLKNRQADRIEIPDFKDSTVMSIAEDRNKHIWIGTYGKIYELMNFKIIRTIKLDDNIKDYVSKLFIDSNGDIWFWTETKGLFCIVDNKLYNIGEKIQLDNITVNSFFEDNNKNVWVSTWGKGVYCFYNDFIFNYGKADGLPKSDIQSVYSLEDEGCLVGTSIGLSLFKNGKFETITSNGESFSIFSAHRIKNTYQDSYNIISSSPFKKLITHLTYNSLSLFIIRAFSGYQIDSENFILCYRPNNKLYFYNLRDEQNKGDITLKDSTEAHNYIFDIEIDKDSSIMAGSDYGLFIIKENMKRTYEINEVLSNTVNKIFHVTENTYIISGLKGIAILKDKEVTNTYTAGQYYDFSNTHSFVLDNDRNLWIGNEKALYVLPLDSFLNGKLNSIRKYDYTSGFSFEGCYITYNKTENCIYVGTSTGFDVINLNRIQDFYTSPQKVRLVKYELTDTAFYSDKEVVFKPDQNNFTLNFVSFNYKSPNSITYEYQFEGSTNWEETKINKINFSQLSPGDYKLFLRAKDINGIKSELTELKFTVLAPFWKTFTFYLILSVGFVGIVSFASYKRISNVKKKARENIEIQRNIASLKHLALSASLNPHFIFNTLNSIQYYINEHSKEEANNYLVNFSRLIRMNLDLAGNTYIILKKELERLELYMRYEKLRFENRMDYTVNIDGNINPEKLEIPNMILQPFVENSIWHGLMKKEGRGKIDINISKNEEVIKGSSYKVIKIEIIDNGIGLEESKKIKKSDHISKGISIIGDRLKLLAPEMKDLDFIKIKDRTDGAQGVYVCITLFPNQYNII